MPVRFVVAMNGEARRVVEAATRMTTTTTIASAAIWRKTSREMGQTYERIVRVRARQPNQLVARVSHTDLNISQTIRSSWHAVRAAELGALITASHAERMHAHSPQRVSMRTCAQITHVRDAYKKRVRRKMQRTCTRTHGGKLSADCGQRPRTHNINIRND